MLAQAAKKGNGESILIGIVALLPMLMGGVLAMIAWNPLSRFLAHASLAALGNEPLPVLARFYYAVLVLGSALTTAVLGQ